MKSSVTTGGKPAGPIDFIIKPVETRRERKLFLELPWQIYRDDPNWMPPLRMNQKELVGYARHPFYDDAKGQTFLALSGGRAVGRIQAIENPVHNRFHNERRGFFGFFESIDDQQVANGLLDAARAWLAARDIHQIRGPVNPSLNYECGLLVEGFHLPPTFMMTYNPPYYARLIENYGFRKSQDMFAFWAPTSIIPKLNEKLLFVAQEAAARLNIVVRPLDKSRFRQEIEMFLDLYNQSLGGTWGFVPLSKREIDHMSASLKHLIIPELAMVASVEGKPIGAVFAIPDYNPRVKQIDGRLFPFGFLKLINKRRALRPLSGDRAQCHSRIPEVGRRAGTAPQPDSQNPGIQSSRCRILVGARVEPSLAPQPRKRGRYAGKDLPHLRLPAAG